MATIRLLLAGLVSVLVPPSIAGAQESARPTMAGVYEEQARARALRSIARADSLLQAGRIAAAEAAYYEVARQRPDDPAPRLALGRYLAARGATKVAIVLIEEARRFGASPTLAGVHLAPLYARIGAWRSLSELPTASLGPGVRARARWLADRTSATEGPDSASVPLRRARGDRSLGALMLRIGEDSLLAEIDPDVDGLVLDRSRLERRIGPVRRFPEGPVEGMDPRVVVGLVERMELGPYTLTNVPVSFAALTDGASARVGLDFLAAFAPTARGETLLLRRAGRVTMAGARYALLLPPGDGARIVSRGRLSAFGVGAIAGLRRTGWTLDSHRGEIVVRQD